MSGVPSHRLGLRRVLTAALLVGALVLGGALGLFAYAASAIDGVQAAKEIELVTLRLERMKTKAVEDVRSATVWNDSVAAFARGDTDWMQENFGDYYADYMGHDVTLVFASSGQMILASRASEPVAAGAEAALITAVAPTVRALQARHPVGLGFEASQERSVVMTVGSKTWLLAIATVVPEDTSVVRPARDPVVVSAQDITAVVNSLAADLALTKPVFAAETVAGQIGLPVLGAGGERLGVLAWTPDRPGADVLRQAGPVLAGLVLCLITAAGVLWALLNRIAQRMESAQAELAEARDRAEAASHAKTRFLTTISHELRTPLNGVLGMAEILGTTPLSTPQRNHLSILKASGEDLLRMIEHILQVTRLERSEVKIETAPFDLGGLLDDLARQTRAALGDRPVTVVVEAEATGEWIGDAEHIRQALHYLMTNAAAFTPEGRIRLASRQQGENLLLSVSDTGVGIDPGFLPRLFDDFAQADETLTRVHEGVGLGLPICRRLVAKMGGAISVDSRPREGSTFTISLPLKRATATATARAA